MKHLWRNAWLLLAALLLLLTVALAADGAETENPVAQDVSPQLPQVTDLRMLTATETVTVHSYREGPVTRTLYPGSLVWNPVAGDVSYMVQYYREIDGDRAVQIGQVSTEDAFFPVDLLWTTLGQGTYYATVTVEPNSAGYLPSEPVQTASWTLAEAPLPLPVPSVTVTGPLATVSGNTNNVARYNLQVLVRGSETEVITLLLDLSDPTYSIDEYLVEENPDIAFSVRAQAVALDPTQNTNSGWSIAVPIDTPERLETPANVRFITEPTTIEVDLGNGAFYEQTLYPGAIVWDAVEGRKTTSSRFTAMERNINITARCRISATNGGTPGSSSPAALIPPRCGRRAMTAQCCPVRQLKLALGSIPSRRQSCKSLPNSAGRVPKP